MSGYAHCACRDCFEIAITGDEGDHLCHECVAAGCTGEIDSPCARPPEPEPPVPPDEITVTVTEDDIKNGQRDDCKYCPIALATRRLYPENTPISVGTSYLHLTTSRRSTATYCIPAVAARFIRFFDWGYIVEPFTFTARRYGT